MTFSMISATVIVILTVAALLKRYETRLVLITAGLAMGIISFAPHIALANMMKNMTNASMILALCSSMGFAAVFYSRRFAVRFLAFFVFTFKKFRFFFLLYCLFLFA